MEPPNPMEQNQEISETIYIEHNSTKYPLNLNCLGDMISFSLDYNSINYMKKISLKEIKDKESKAIFLSQSTKDFIEFLKTLSEIKKILLVKKENTIDIKFEFEMMFKKHEIEIELKDKNKELLEKELKELKEENKELKNRIDNLETEIKEIKKILMPDFNLNKLKTGNKSAIMQEEEFGLINMAIKNRFNKEILGLKKLYQATIDGDNIKTFHLKCDNIPNTLVLIKSAGNRRFGGFNSMTWSSIEKDEWKEDPNSFLFSLDKHRIYSLNIKNGKAIYNRKDYGPCFGQCEIQIGQHCIEEKGLYTGESSCSYSFNYGGDSNALSEDGKTQGIYADEYEVFQILF